MMLRHSLPLLLVLAAPVLWAAPEEIVFCSYNLENYTQGKPRGEGSKYGARPKSEAAIQTMVGIVKEIHPDILGVCEMGSAERLADFQRRLKEAGVDLPETEWVEAVDEDRHLALLSRFPIVKRESRSDVRFVLNGQEERVRRGFLDVTVAINDEYRLRCVGVHLKSKLPTPQGEGLIRRMEASKLREHIDGILEKESDVNLICYGDFNDTRNEPTFQAVTGPRGAAGYLSELSCTDALGDRWTHYWRTADEYSRIDYLFVSRALMPEIDQTRTSIYRSANWYEASDHRPIYTGIHPANAKTR